MRNNGIKKIMSTIIICVLLALVGVVGVHADTAQVTAVSAAEITQTNTAAGGIVQTAASAGSVARVPATVSAQNVVPVADIASLMTMGGTVHTTTAQDGTQLQAIVGDVYTIYTAADGTQTVVLTNPPTAAINSCTIDSTKSNITIKATGQGDMQLTDGYFYLFELQPYQDELDGRSDYLGYAKAGSDMTWSVSLNYGTTEDRLYSRFAIATYDGTKYTRISEPYYITNPEIVAADQSAFMYTNTKKGLSIQVNMLEDAFSLQVDHVVLNFAFNQLLGEGIDFTYDGETYHFSKAIMEGYDKTISALSNKGICVTAIVLNAWNENDKDLVYPTSQVSDASFYMINVSTQKGFKKAKAMMAFLAQRYNGKNSSQGKVSNWILGNEIGHQQWNYAGEMDLDTYVRTYMKAFRVFYTAIKSTTASSRVYFSLDFYWNKKIENNNRLTYTGRSIFDKFNELAAASGQFDWGLAYHPYPYPLADPNFWDDYMTGEVTQSLDSPIINFANIGYLTGYLKQAQNLSPTGSVRHFMLTEEGFTATDIYGNSITDLQAAAFAYSYYIADSDPVIEAYILHRQVDAPEEVSANVSFGLWACDMNQPNTIVATKRRKIWQVFRDIDKRAKTLETTEFAKKVIGIEKWSDLIPNFKWRYLE